MLGTHVLVKYNDLFTIHICLYINKSLSNDKTIAQQVHHPHAISINRDFQSNSTRIFCINFDHYFHCVAQCVPPLIWTLPICTFLFIYQHSQYLIIFPESAVLILIAACDPLLLHLAVSHGWYLLPEFVLFLAIY